MTSLPGASPAGAGSLDRTGIVAVKKICAPPIRPDVLGFDPIDDHQQRGTVGVFTAVSDPDRLHARIPVPVRAVGQK
jgi:hypothetical protein